MGFVSFKLPRQTNPAASVCLKSQSGKWNAGNILQDSRANSQLVNRKVKHSSCFLLSSFYAWIAVVGGHTTWEGLPNASSSRNLQRKDGVSGHRVSSHVHRLEIYIYPSVSHDIILQPISLHCILYQNWSSSTNETSERCSHWRCSCHAWYRIGCRYSWTTKLWLGPPLEASRTMQFIWILSWQIQQTATWRRCMKEWTKYPIPVVISSVHSLLMNSRRKLIWNAVWSPYYDPKAPAITNIVASTTINAWRLCHTHPLEFYWTSVMITLTIRCSNQYKKASIY